MESVYLFCLKKWSVKIPSIENPAFSKILDDAISLSGSVISISFSASDTENLSGAYYHEAEITDTSNNVSTSWSHFGISNAVTDAE